MAERMVLMMVVLKDDLMVEMMVEL